MQTQLTIFGNEVKPPRLRTAAPGFNMALAVIFCDDSCRPCFIPGKAPRDKGIWIMAIDHKAFGQVPGTRMGISGRWTFKGTNEFQAAVAREGFTSMVGTCLMNGNAILIEQAGLDFVTFKTFGILASDSSTRTIYRRSERWVSK